MFFCFKVPLCLQLPPPPKNKKRQKGGLVRSGKETRWKRGSHSEDPSSALFFFSPLGTGKFFFWPKMEPPRPGVRLFFFRGRALLEKKADQQKGYAQKGTDQTHLGGLIRAAFSARYQKGPLILTKFFMR